MVPGYKVSDFMELAYIPYQGTDYRTGEIWGLVCSIERIVHILFPAMPAIKINLTRCERNKKVCKMVLLKSLRYVDWILTAWIDVFRIEQGNCRLGRKEAVYLQDTGLFLRFFQGKNNHDEYYAYNFRSEAADHLH